MVDCRHFIITLVSPVDVGILTAKKKLRLKKVKECIQGQISRFIKHHNLLSFIKTVFLNVIWD